MPEREDEDLVIAAQAGDRGAFGELIERYQGKIYNVALRISGNREDALDATQTAFLKAYDHLDRFDPSYRFFSWLYRIGLNETLNLVNRRKKTASLSIVPVASGDPDPNDLLLERETSLAVQAALLDLEPHHRVMIVLRHFHGLSYREISEITEVPPNTVKSRLFTARQQLRRRLEARGLVGGRRGGS